MAKTTMRLWVDDLREPPPRDAGGAWTWVKTSAEAIEILGIYKRRLGEEFWRCTVMSLDHDLGGDDTTRPVVLWMCESGYWPEVVLCHSSNPVGREYIEGMVARYKP